MAAVPEQQPTVGGPGGVCTACTGLRFTAGGCVGVEKYCALDLEELVGSCSLICANSAAWFSNSSPMNFK